MAVEIEAFQKISKQADAHGARLVAVSKTKPASDILTLYEAGQRMFGENYVQELLGKHPVLPGDIAWHFIGHLQRNKVKYIAPFVSMIQTVDSLPLLQEINKQARKAERTIDCLVEVHIAREDSKYGVSEADLLEMVEKVQAAPGEYTHVRLRGLMGMATFTDDIKVVQGEFRNLKTISERVRARFGELSASFTELSMGMSADYEWALEEGSTLIRVGSRLFGARV